jgi:hypothetical protein
MSDELLALEQNNTWIVTDFLMASQPLTANIFTRLNFMLMVLLRD